MAENTKRSAFGLNGIFGMLISVVLLLVILVGLSLFAVIAQRDSATKPYDPSVIRDINNLKQIDVNNKQYAFQDAKKDK